MFTSEEIKLVGMDDNNLKEDLIRAGNILYEQNEKTHSRLPTHVSRSREKSRMSLADFEGIKVP